MRKKLLLSALFLVCIITAACGLNAFAGATPSSLSDTITGSFVKMDQNRIFIRSNEGERAVTVAQEVWVYRNGGKALLTDLVPGDDVELILNSKDQAAYIKANSEEARMEMNRTQPTDTQTGVTSGLAAAQSPSTPAATIAPSASPAAATPKNAPAANSPAGSIPTSPGSASSWDSLELTVSGPQFKLVYKESPGNSGRLPDLSLKTPKSGTVHIRGDSARQWLSQIIAGSGLNDQAVKERLRQILAAQYGMKPEQLTIQLNVHWQTQGHSPNLLPASDNAGGKAQTAPAEPKDKDLKKSEKEEKKKNKEKD